MDSMEAMDHIEKIFLGVRGPIWLPQWSFDFWIIPYLKGRGMTLRQFKAFCQECREMLSMEIAFVPPEEKQRRQQSHLIELRRQASEWNISP